MNDSNFHFTFLLSLLLGSSTNAISPLLFNAGLVSHYRRYLNPVDPRMFATNANVTELNKSNCKGKKIECTSLLPTQNSGRITVGHKFHRLISEIVAKSSRKSFEFRSILVIGLLLVSHRYVISFRLDDN
jgi:hypothetical protein